MAAGQTSSTGFCDREPDGKLVRTKRYSISDVTWICRGMSIVAGPAGPAFRLFVDMDIMQILVPVSEIGQGCCLWILRQGFAMAHETEGKIVVLIGGIEFFRKERPKNAEIAGTVGVMAGRAVFILDGPVVTLVLGQKGFHVGDFFTILVCVFPVMAGEAEVHGCIVELLWK